MAEHASCSPIPCVFLCVTGGVINDLLKLDMDINLQVDATAGGRGAQGQMRGQDVKLLQKLRTHPRIATLKVGDAPMWRSPRLRGRLLGPWCNYRGQIGQRACRAPPDTAGAPRTRLVFISSRNARRRATWTAPLAPTAHWSAPRWRRTPGCAVSPRGAHGAAGGRPAAMRSREVLAARLRRPAPSARCALVRRAQPGRAAGRRVQRGCGRAAATERRPALGGAKPGRDARGRCDGSGAPASAALAAGQAQRAARSGACRLWKPTWDPHPTPPPPTHTLRAPQGEAYTWGSNAQAELGMPTGPGASVDAPRRMELLVGWEVT